jgi:deazaflavin-dependent oxidoreductase (nitroreductase family)
MMLMPRVHAMPTRRPDPPLLAFARPFTTAVVNRLTRLFAGHLPGFAIVDYRGRRSGKAYRTPMNVFRDGDDYVFALTYGSDAQWVKNVLAAGECDLEVRGKRVHLIEPKLFADPSRHLMPQPVRFFLGVMRVTEFLRMRPGTSPAAERDQGAGQVR